jgi:hypothetical protein
LPALLVPPVASIVSSESVQAFVSRFMLASKINPDKAF